MTLIGFTLQIYNPQKSIAFYTNTLGMQLVKEETKESTTTYSFSFPKSFVKLQLKYNAQLAKKIYTQKPLDNYWKYSLFVPNNLKTEEEFLKLKHPIGEPFQFEEIGYLAHTQDLENHQIEFIQTTFKGNSATDNTSSSTNTPALGLLTIRTKDPIKTIKMYEDLLDLKLFVRMQVNRGNGFTLYFLGSKNLKVPNPDIDAIENREWMYQQKHLFIEVQQYWGNEQDSSFSLNTLEDQGLQTINFKGSLQQIIPKLETQNIPYERKKNHIYFQSIDKHLIQISE